MCGQFELSQALNRAVILATDIVIVVLEIYSMCGQFELSQALNRAVILVTDLWGQFELSQALNRAVIQVTDIAIRICGVNLNCHRPLTEQSYW